MPLYRYLHRSLKVADKEQKHFDGGGLYLSIPKTGRQLWRMAYRFDQKTKLLSFGEYPTITLKDARQRRDEAKKLLANGIDPGAQKKAAKEEQISEVKDTFQSIALEWHDTRTAEFSDKHRGTIMYRLETYLFPAIGKAHIAKLEPQDILAVVRPIEQRGLYDTSRRLLQIISQVFRYAVITGRAKHNVAADLRGALRPRKVTHRATITEPAKLVNSCETAKTIKATFLSSALCVWPLWFLSARLNFVPPSGPRLTSRPRSGVFLLGA